MAPVLLDQRRLLQIISGLLLALMIAFSSGYYFGYRKAETRLPKSSERLSLPESTPEAADNIAPIVPEVIEPGAEIDVDVPDNQPVTTGVQPESSQPLKPNAKAATRPEQNLVPTASVATASATGKAIVSEPPTNAALAIGGPAPDIPEEDAQASPAAADDASAEDALYSIQVGIYGSQANAQRQVDKLSEQNLSAYLDEYLNKDNQMRYNVRFGYFASRASAVAALDAWQRAAPKQSSSGYVVRLSR